MGDVTTRDVLETYGLLPKYKPATELYFCVLDEKYQNYANKLSQKLREGGLNVSVDYSGKKVGDQIKYADRNLIPFVVCVGENEVKNEEFKVKNLKSSEETTLKIEEISSFIRQQE